MEVPPPNSEIEFQRSSMAFAWDVFALLLRHGRPTDPSELASTYTLFNPSPDFITSLCSIPNSPIRVTDNHSVTFSQTGIAAFAQFLANSGDIAGYLNAPQFVPRLLANVRPNDVLRTYCRKRKRFESDIEYFPLVKKRSCLLDFNDEENQQVIDLTMPDEFQRAQNQGIETVPSVSSPSVHNCLELNNTMFGPTMTEKSQCGQLVNEIENVKTRGTFLSKEEPGYSYQKPCESDSHFQGGIPLMHNLIVAEDITRSSAQPKLSLPEVHTCYSEGNGTGNNIAVVTSICTSPKLEVDEMKVPKTEDQVCELLTENVDTKIKESLLFASGSCRGHKENLPLEVINEDMSDTNFLDMKVNHSNYLTPRKLFAVTPEKEGNLQSQEDMLDHPMKCSSISLPFQKNDMNDWGKSISLTIESCKSLPDKTHEQYRRAKNQTLDKEKGKGDCNHAKEKETFAENSKKASFTTNSHTEQKPFPSFESFVVEEEEGSGGYGTVYRARRKSDGVTFAIKCPHVNANMNYVQNELKMLERLGGKNFVINYEGSLKSENGDCLVLQHFEHDRPEILKREIDITQIHWYGYCLFKALACLHKQGIVHRDVKPGNFLFSRKANKGYLVDFNLALDMHKKYRQADNSKAAHEVNFDRIPASGTKSLPPEKNRKPTNAKFRDASNKNTGKVSKSPLLPVNLKRKVDKTKDFVDTASKNNIKSQGAEGSGITSAKIPSAERLKEPLPSQGRRELLSLVQESLQAENHRPVNAPISRRKRVAAPSGDVNRSSFFYPTPMPVHANGMAIPGAGLLKGKVDGKNRREGPCVGTKGFKAPEVLFRSPHQSLKMDIWSAGVTLLYLMTGRTPFVGDTDQNIKEIAKLRGSEDLWEVAKLHNRESSFPTDLLDIKCLSPIKLRDWCSQNTRRPDLLEVLPRSLFDLVDKCLMVNPRQRISAEEALAHEFFSPCHKALKKHRLQDKGQSGVSS